jgi:organic radical activating enzyme
MPFEKTLAITTRVGCKNQCSYCPQEMFVKEYAKRSRITVMTLDTFMKCIDKLPADVSINFAAFSEPFYNPECPKMILYAHKKGFRLRVYTSATGITHSDIDLIEDIPFLLFYVHLPNSEGQTKIKIDENYLNIIERLIHSKINIIKFHYHESYSKSVDIHPKLKELFKGNELKLDMCGLTSRGGNIEIEGMRKPKKIKGPLPECERLYVNVLLPNGDVTLCCMDWKLKYILGNLLEQEYADLFNGAEFTKIIRELSCSDSDILCRTCEYLPGRKNISRNFISLSKYLLGGDVKRIGKSIKYRWDKLF